MAGSGGEAGEGAAGGQSGAGGEGGGDSDAVCGDGIVGGDETCDDENGNEADGCVECTLESGWQCNDATPSVCFPRIVSMAGGKAHICAALANGTVLCWGSNVPYIQTGNYTGFDDWRPIGDDETPGSVGPLPIDGTARSVGLGQYHSCVLLEGGRLRCWGDNSAGKLGYGNVDFYSDAGTVEDVNVGSAVQQVVGTEYVTCVLLAAGTVRCWGGSSWFGDGSWDSPGDDEVPAEIPDVDVGGPVQQLAGGWNHVCALLTTGNVRCWGDGSSGQLGYGNLNFIGDDETPASAGDVNVGGPVRQIAAADYHTCAVLTTGKVRCWGAGALGYGNLHTIGDDEVPAIAGDVDLGAGVVIERIVANGMHTCAVSTAGALYCWGYSWAGQTGYATKQAVGDDEVPADVGPVNVGGPVDLVAAGNVFTCAQLVAGGLRCWGDNQEGQLGYGHTIAIGDNEVPSTVGFVEYFR
jgi:cysteine-rich repeat protein